MIRKNTFAVRDLRPLLIGSTALLFTAAALFAVSARAQEAVEAVAPAYTQAELEELVAPVALYPDDVLGIILPAATFPLQIVQASRFLDDLENDASLQPDEDWDDSIVALLNYPEVLRMMNEDLDWTWALGGAVLTDQSAVLAAAQDFRQRAYAAGNLETDDRQVVTETDGAIEIKPADPKVVYIPYYDPREVVVYHSRPVYYYYPVAYPLYYYPYPVGYSFSTGFFFGITSWFSVGWHSHYVHVHHHSHRLHPYYLDTHYYYRPYYYRSGVHITVNVNNYNYVWQPPPQHGARPRTATVTGRTSTVRTPRTATVETQPGVLTRQSATPRSSGAANTKLAPAARNASGRTTADQTSTRTAQASQSRRSGVGQGDRASASNRASGSTAAPGQPGNIVRPYDVTGASTRTGAAGASRSSARSSTISGVSESQIRSVPARPSTSAAVKTTPRQTTPIPRSSTRAASAPAPSTSVTPRATIAAPRSSSAAPRTTTSQTTVRTPSPAPRSSFAAPRSAPSATHSGGTTRSGGSNSNGGNSSSSSRGTIGASASSHSTSSSSSRRR